MKDRVWELIKTLELINEKYNFKIPNDIIRILLIKTFTIEPSILRLKSFNYHLGQFINPFHLENNEVKLIYIKKGYKRQCSLRRNLDRILNKDFNRNIELKSLVNQEIKTYIKKCSNLPKPIWYNFTRVNNWCNFIHLPFTESNKKRIQNNFINIKKQKLKFNEIYIEFMNNNLVRIFENYITSI